MAADPDHCAAETRVQAALDSIEEAQRLLERAGQSLSRVDGMISEWERVGSTQDQIRQAWYAVAARANRLRRRGPLRLD